MFCRKDESTGLGLFDHARHDKMVALVECMLELHRKLAAASIPDDKKLYQRQIKATDHQIDALVYGLTADEIKIVGGVRPPRYVGDSL